jgi:hypothetical protein
MPILGEVGVDPGEPTLMAIHHMEQTSGVVSGATAA